MVKVHNITIEPRDVGVHSEKFREITTKTSFKSQVQLNRFHPYLTDFARRLSGMCSAPLMNSIPSHALSRQARHCALLYIRPSATTISSLAKTDVSSFQNLSPLRFQSRIMKGGGRRKIAPLLPPSVASKVRWASGKEGGREGAGRAGCTGATAAAGAPSRCPHTHVLFFEGNGRATFM